MTKIQQTQIRKKFMHYIVPSIASMWVYTIYTMVDGMFVARGVSTTALAAVNIVMPFINFTFAVGLLLAVGASTLVSVYMGQEKKEKANEIFTTSVITVFSIGLFITIMVQLNVGNLADLLGATDATRKYVMDYLRTIVIFDVFFMTSYNLEVLVKADGFPSLAIKTTTVGCLCNFILDYLFVIVFKWGIIGAAVATGISQITTFTVFMIHFLSKRSNLSFIKIKYKFSSIKKMMKLGASDAMTEFSVGIVIFLFNNTLIRVVGDNGVVIYTVIAYVSQLILMTMMGLNQGMQPLVSYYYGKGEKGTHKYLLNIALKCAITCSIVAFVMGVLYPDPVVAAFIDKSKDMVLFTDAVSAFKLFSFSFLPLGVVVILAGYFTALEKPKYAITVSMSRGLILVIISLAIMTLLFGEVGIWLSMGVSETLALVLALILYRKGAF